LLTPQRVQFRYRLEGIDKAWQQGNPQSIRVWYVPHSPLLVCMAHRNREQWRTSAARTGL
jgi:hypothetical protein